MRFNKLVPEFDVSDIKNSLDFYVKILGFKIEYERKQDKFAFLSLNGSQIMIQQSSKWKTGKLEYPYGRGINFQIEVKDIKKILDSLKKHNWPLKYGLEENSYKVSNKNVKCKEFLVQDPDGILIGPTWPVTTLATLVGAGAGFLLGRAIGKSNAQNENENRIGYFEQYAKEYDQVNGIPVDSNEGLAFQLNQIYETERKTRELESNLKRA